MLSGREPSPYCEVYAKDIVASFPDADPEEIVNALKKGRRGYFGVYYKLNGTVLYEWVKKHLAEVKYNSVKRNSAGRPIVGDFKYT